jgi:chromosome partitioning protein
MRVFDTKEAAKQLGISHGVFIKRQDEYIGLPVRTGDKTEFFYPEPLLQIRKSDIVGGQKQTIAYINIKGGVGKTTVSTNAAYTLAHLGLKVLFVDTDAQSNGTRFFRVDGSDGLPTLFHLFHQVSNGEKPQDIPIETIQKAIRRVNYKDDVFVDVLPSHQLLSKVAETLRSTVKLPHKVLGKLLKRIRDEYDYIVIDTPPNPGIILEQSVNASDEIVIVTEPSDYALAGVKTILDELEELKDELDHKIACSTVFINRANSTWTVQAYQSDQIRTLAEQHGIDNVYLIPNLSRVAFAQDCGSPLILETTEIKNSSIEGDQRVRRLKAAEGILNFALQKARKAA